MIDVYVSGLTIDCGRQGENLARNIIFELQSLIDTYGEGTATLVCMRPSDKVPYVCETTQDDAVLTWTPTSTDTAYAGSGKCELRWVVGDTLAKSIIYTTTIAPSITGAEGVPDAYRSWYDAMMDYIKNNYSESGAPQEVREAIYTLLSKAAYIETGLEDELATVEAWAVEHFTITNNLTNVSTNNNTGIIVGGSSYTATLTASSGYDLGAVTVIMGEEDVTSTVYSNGTITIADVTGDIIITASGTAAIVSISAVYTQPGTVYNTEPINSLKDDLVVTATYGDSTTQTIAGSDYTLSGILTEGTSEITVSYRGKTATFNVTVTRDPSSPIYSWDLTRSLTDTVSGVVASTTATFTEGTGIVFSEINKYCDFGAVYGRNRTYELDIAEIGTMLTNSGSYKDYARFLAFDTDANTSSGGASVIQSAKSGRYGWCFYKGSAWGNVFVSGSADNDGNRTYFSGKTLKVYLDSTGIAKVSVKDIGASDETYTVVGTSNGALNDYTNGHVYVGSNTNDYTGNATITGLRIYEGEK